MDSTAPAPVVSDPEKPGLKSSEGKVTVGTSVVGAALIGLGATFTQLQTDFPESKWVGVFVALMGVAQMVFTQIAYMHKRTDLKVAQLELRKTEAAATALISSAASNATQTALQEMAKTIASSAVIGGKPLNP